MIIEQNIKIRWVAMNKKYYEEKGYKYTKHNEFFIINVKDLSHKCGYNIKIQCDYCGAIFEYYYSAAIHQDSHACKNCSNTKRKRTCLKKYGVENYSQTQEFKDKRIQTCLDRYGVENCMLLDETKNKKKQTTIDKYGVENYSQTEEYQIKKTQTTIDRYGVKHYSQLEECKIKVKETNLERHGAEYYSQTKEWQDKIKETNLERHGVEYVFQSEEVKEKIKQTNLENHGVEYYTQTEDFKEKSKETNLENYGEEHYSQTEECKERKKQTCLKNYGVENPFQSEEIKKEIQEKIRVTLYKNGNGPSSKPQDYLCELLIGRNNYPVRGYSLDIAFPDELLDIEYNGGGHYVHANLEEVNKSDMRRKYYLMSQGWKIITIISKKDWLPLDEEIILLIKQCKEYLNSGRHWIEIDIDNKVINCSQYNKILNFNQLRRIK